MSFWGVEVKPGKPYTHLPDNDLGRLRISQATLGNGSANNKSTLQCNVGNKRPILLCCLVPDRIESCSLCLEYEESEEVIFSVLGSRSIHLAGYYLREHSLKDPEEVYGEDIGDQDTEESNSSSGNNSYEDSFIDDEEEKVLPPSPIFAGRGRRRRLQKKIYVSDSDEQNDSVPPVALNGNASVPGIINEDEDKVTISSLLQLNSPNKNSKATEDAETSMEKNTCLLSVSNKDMAEDELNEFVAPKRQADVDGLSCEMESQHPKRKELVQDGDTFDESAFDRHTSVVKGDKHAFDNGAGIDIRVQLDPSQERDALNESAHDNPKLLVKGDNYVFEDEVKPDSELQSNPFRVIDALEKSACDRPKSVVKENKKALEDVAQVDSKLQSDPSQEVDSFENSAGDSRMFEVKDNDNDDSEDKTKVDSKFQSDQSQEVACDSLKHVNQEEPDAFEHETEVDSHKYAVKYENSIFEEAKFNSKVPSDPSNDKALDISNDEHATSTRKRRIKEENHESNKSMKKKRKVKNGDEEILEYQERRNMEIPIPSAVEDGRIMETADLDANIMTFSNGLVIEELKLGKANGQVASYGKKVRVHFVGRLKDCEEIIDSNIGDAPFKFRLGGPSVIEGWSIGVDGMRVHGKRRLTIPPSLGYGVEGYGDCIPPNSWLVYEMELTAVL